MTTIKIIKDGVDYKGFVSEGHATRDFRGIHFSTSHHSKYFNINFSFRFTPKVDSVVCAAISALTQTLVAYLNEFDLVENYKSEKGLIIFEAKQTDKKYLINTAFEMMIVGLLSIRENHPKEIEIVY